MIIKSTKSFSKTKFSKMLREIDFDQVLKEISDYNSDEEIKNTINGIYLSF